MSHPGLDAWRAYLASHDPKVLWELLDPDAVFESPVVHTPQRGRDITFKYLSGAGQVLGNPNFRYTGEWTSESGVVLEFETELEGVKVNGVDIITFDEGGKIVHFKVMIRPLKAINMVHQMMGAELAKAAS